MRQTLKRKGVSPLIAVVLLIAFTLAIGGFLSSWLQEIVHDQTDEAAQNADAGCIYSTFNADDATFNASGDNRLVFDIVSTGTRDIIITKIAVTTYNMTREEYTSPENFTGTISAGDIVGVSLPINTNRIPNITRVRVIADGCPQNSDEILDTEITTYS